jgi:hypothetical protein
MPTVRRFRYHESCRAGKIFDLADAGFKELEKDGWVDTPAKLPDPPKEATATDEGSDAPSDAGDEADAAQAKLPEPPEAATPPDEGSDAPSDAGDEADAAQAKLPEPPEAATPPDEGSDAPPDAGDEADAVLEQFKRGPGRPKKGRKA